MINLLPPGPATGTTPASSALRAELFDWAHELLIPTQMRETMLLLIARATTHSTAIVTTGELAEMWQVTHTTARQRLKRMAHWRGPNSERLVELRTHPEDRVQDCRSEDRRRILLIHQPGGPWDRARAARELEFGVLNAMRGPLAEERSRRATLVERALLEQQREIRERR